MRMQMHLAGLDWYGRYGRRIRRRRWGPGSIVLTAALGVIALSIVLCLLVLATTGAVLLGGAYVGYRVLRRAYGGRAIESPRRNRQRLAREARGLLEMARTPDPLDRYLLAVREFDRLSAEALAVDPVDLPRARTARRAADLAEQAHNLYDAVAEIERQVTADTAADGALANVWELSVACGDLWSYCRDLRQVRRAPSLADLRAFITRRTALIARRDALVTRLQRADLGRAIPPATRIPVRSLDA